MLRITTNGVLRNYKSNLMRSSNNLDKSRNKVLTQRNFTKYSEDPAAASLAFKLRRNFSAVSDQATNVNSLVNKFQSAWDCLSQVKSDLTEKSGKVSALRGANGTTGAGRQPLGEVLKNAAESVVQTMNTKYGDSFVFAGSDGHTVPFSWDSAGKLLYRGVEVASGTAATLPAGNPPDPDSVTTGDGGWGDYYYNNEDFAQLVRMSEESAYVDVGAGLAEDGSGNLIKSTAFDSAISGIDVLGFGVDADGDPKNIASIMMELGKIFSRCDSDSGEFASTSDETLADRLTGKLEDGLAAITNKWTELDGKSNFLENTKTRLKDAATSINEQILSIEQVDMADAITEFSWAQYCYNAALKAGNSIFSQSLIDYMN